MAAASTRAVHETCVLIVDDDEGVRESVRDVVEMMGCSAMLAANSEEALTLLAKNRPCLVVLDLLMPGMSGGEMLEVMRQQAELSSLPVVISTSAPERAPRGVPVLRKPIDVKILCEWMRRTCGCPDRTSGLWPKP